MTDQASDSEILNQMISGFWFTKAICIAAELGISDLLTDGPKTAEELAASTSTHSESLYRVLRALASVGIYTEVEPHRFSLTSLAQRLSSTSPDKQRALAIVMGGEMYKAWGNLGYSVQTGAPSFDETFDMALFEYLGTNPKRGEVFDAAMTGIHGGETEPMVDAYDFSQFGKVVDVGGGNGSVLRAILSRNSHVDGILYDLPAVLERAPDTFANTGLSSRCEFQSGSFFESVPSGGDAYLMRHIVHDWDDESAVAILRNCREAMNPNGKVLVVETVIPTDNSPSFGKWLDLMMLVIGGKERTEAQYRELFSKAGLELSRIVPTDVEISVVEGIRKD